MRVLYKQAYVRIFRLRSFYLVKYEPVLEKTNNLGFRPGPTKTKLYSNRSRLKLKEKRDSMYYVVKTKALISFAVTAKLVCAFVFAYANCWFSHAVARISINFTGKVASLILNLFSSHRFVVIKT